MVAWSGVPQGAGALVKGRLAIGGAGSVAGTGVRPPADGDAVEDCAEVVCAGLACGCPPPCGVKKKTAPATSPKATTAMMITSSVERLAGGSGGE
jgi:hypothetical protein